MYQSKSLGPKLPRDSSVHGFACPSPGTVHWYEACPKMTSESFAEGNFHSPIHSPGQRWLQGLGCDPEPSGKQPGCCWEGREQVPDPAPPSVHRANAEMTAGHAVPRACRQAGGGSAWSRCLCPPHDSPAPGMDRVLLPAMPPARPCPAGVLSITGREAGAASRAVPAVAGVGHVELAHEVDGSQGTAAPGETLGRSLPLDLLVLGRQRAAPGRAGRWPQASKQKQPKIVPGCSGSTSAAGGAELLLQVGSSSHPGPRHLSPRGPGAAAGLGDARVLWGSQGWGFTRAVERAGKSETEGEQLGLLE